MTKVIDSSVTVSKIKRITIFPQAICQESENLGEDAVDNAFFAALHLVLGNVLGTSALAYEKEKMGSIANQPNWSH